MCIRDRRKHLSEVQIGLCAVEASQGLDECRRNDERRVRVAEGIAQHQPGSFGDRRRQELDVIAETRELLRHCYIISARSRVQRKQIIELIK